MIQIINLISLQRCGTHAFANWLLSQDEEEKGKLTHISDDIWIKSKGSRCSVLLNSIEFHQENLGVKHFILKKLKNKNKIDKIIICYESGELKNYCEGRLYRQLEEIFKNPIYINVMNLRSVLNFGASWYKQFRTIPPHMLPQWRERANEYLGNTRFLNSIKVRYDNWASDKNYREKIVRAVLVKGVFTDLGIDDVPGFGGGSSFDGITMDGEGSKMSVNLRYKQFENDPNFMNLFTSKDLSMSKEIFGE